MITFLVQPISRIILPKLQATIVIRNDVNDLDILQKAGMSSRKNLMSDGGCPNNKLGTPNRFGYRVVACKFAVSPYDGNRT